MSASVEHPNASNYDLAYITSPLLNSSESLKFKIFY